MKDLASFFEDKDILITGGCGFIGSEIVRQLLNFNIKRVRVYDNNEFMLFKLGNLYKENKSLRLLIGDVRDSNRLRRAMEDVDIVFHAAAFKHVPLCEYNPYEAIKTNVIGTQNALEIAGEAGVDRFIFVSTDKAVNPINTMGATKLLCEKIVLNADVGNIKTKYSCVRFGNVLNSSGSVIPVFKQQIQNGGPVTLTTDDMRRFFMPVRDAVRLVLKSSTIMQGREIFILKMHSMLIRDLAEVLIENTAMKYGYKPEDIKITIIGGRVGEKIDELLITEEESTRTNDLNDMLVVLSDTITPHRVAIVAHNHSMARKIFDSGCAELLKKQDIERVLKTESII